ncbi:MAG: 50S ribosomal protein L19 [Candidatus Peribacteria bacterium]|nr:MAG: 50S ribosomal protein L19 [Candidatus Peribacteria bacterium]
MEGIRLSKGYHILGVKPGQQIEIHEKVGQEGNERIWKFKGLVLKVKKPNHPDGTFTIRGKTAGLTIEKIYPLSFTKFEKVLLVDEYKIRRAKLYYLRDKVGKGAKLKSIATAEQKGRDLLAEAREAAEAGQAAYLATYQPAAAVAETPVVEEEVVAQEEVQAEAVVEELAEVETPVEAPVETTEETSTEEVSE